MVFKKIVGWSIAPTLLLKTFQKPKEVEMMKRRESIRLAGAIVVAVAILLLLPCLSIAGSLEPPAIAVDPSGNPVPTMKTLDQIPPTWSQKLQCDTAACPRFEIVMDGAAVLDKETGLVWERSPRTYTGNWYNAQWECWAHNTGERWGWRLPTIYELVSLAELVAHDCYGLLPCGHPFTNAICTYWSATTWFWDANEAISFSRLGTNSFSKDSELCYWCVRGGYGINVNE
jgi:hypothetical protein